MRTTRLVEWGSLALILLLAACLRLTRLDLIEFKYDEATTARSALEIAREGRLPAVGMISSLGPRNPPLMSYLLALPFALSRDPRLAAGFIAFLGVAAVGLTYWVGRAYFGWPVGAIASLLFAASPWAIFHSRKIWAQNVPAVTLLFVAAVLAMVARHKPWALTGALAATACLVGLHLGGLAFIFVLLFVMLLFLRHVRPKPLLVGLALGSLVLGPYLLHDAHHDWLNLRALISLAGQEAVLDLQALRMAALIVGGYHLEDLAGERSAQFLSSVLNIRWLDWAEMGLFWIGLAWAAILVGQEAWTHRCRLSLSGASRLVLLVWCTVPVALLLRHAGPVYPHALSLLYPAQHLLIALFMADLLKLIRRRCQGPTRRLLTLAAVAPILALALWQAVLQQSLLSFVGTVETPGGYGAPVKYSLAAASRAERLAGGAGGEVFALLPGADPRYDDRAAVFDVILEADHRLVDGRSALVLPSHPAVYLAGTGVEPAVSNLADLAHAVEPALPVRAGSDDVYRFFLWEPIDVMPAILHSGDPVRWASGAALLGYDWSGDLRPGGSARWTLYYRVESLPPAGSDLHWFNHLIDREGVRWGQKDGVGVPSPEWRVGDTVLAWFEIPISEDAPPPPYYVRTGQYMYPDVVNVSLIDLAGNPAGEFIELGPLDEAP